MSLLAKLARIPFILWFAVAGGLAYMDYTEWESNTLAMLDSEKSQKESRLAQVKRDTGRAEDFRRRKEQKLRELQELSRKIEATRQQYPTSPNIAQLLKDLADVADRTGLEFHSFKPGAERRQEFIVTTTIDVRLRGTYIQVMSFLDTASNLKRTVTAEKLSLENPSVRDGSVSLVNATATLATYSVDESVTSITEPPPSTPPPPKGRGG